MAMIRTTLTAAALAIGSLGSPAMADTAEVWCFTQQTGHAPTSVKACGFSQRQGNVRVHRDTITYVFHAEQQGIRYERVNDQGGIVFRSPNGLLRVFWERPCSEWTGCAGGG